MIDFSLANLLLSPTTSMECRGQSRTELAPLTSLLSLFLSLSVPLPKLFGRNLFYSMPVRCKKLYFGSNETRPICKNVLFEAVNKPLFRHHTSTFDYNWTTHVITIRPKIYFTQTLFYQIILQLEIKQKNLIFYHFIRSQSDQKYNNNRNTMQCQIQNMQQFDIILHFLLNYSNIASLFPIVRPLLDLKDAES